MSKDATSDNNLTKAEENKVILGNIATLPFQELFDFLTKKSPGEIAGARPPTRRVAARRGDQRNFGATNPTAALAWVATITDSQQASSALQGAIVGWSQKEPQAAMDYVAAHADQLAFQQTAGTLAGNLAQHDPDEATRWLDQLPPAARLHAVTGIAAALAFNDPQAAIHWAESLPPNEQDSAASMIVSRGAQKDPQAVADWIATLKGDTRDNAVATYSSAVAAKDPATALSWAETVSNPGTRDRASWEVAWRWLQSDPAVARAWIRKSALPDDEKKRLLGPSPAP